MSNKFISPTEQTVRSAFQFIEKNPTLQVQTKIAISQMIKILFGMESIVFRPGDVVYLSKSSENTQGEPYLVCMTGSYKGKQSIRFCNMISGIRAGKTDKQAYQLQEGDEITVDQIEKYFKGEYKVLFWKTRITQK